jgi:hypothetical protein
VITITQILARAFVSASNAIRVTQGGPFAAPSGTDAITKTFPSATVEVWSYRTGGEFGTVLMTVTYTFTDSTKCTWEKAVVT